MPVNVEFVEARSRSGKKVSREQDVKRSQPRKKTASTSKETKIKSGPSQIINPKRTTPIPVSDDVLMDVDAGFIEDTPVRKKSKASGKVNSFARDLHMKC
jgi:hypothetical protein